MKPAAEQIRAEIAVQGIISFARFMDLALYCPHSGYYERKADTTGKRGDFYTSVSVGPLFGELLAFQFAGWLSASEVSSLESRVLSPESGVQSSESEAAKASRSFQIVEAGAHDGRLAKDILSWLRLRRPALFERIEYWIVEPSARRQAWQEEALKEFAPRVRWSASRFTQPASRLNGIIFSNELLDAMPVHRLGWDARRHEWFEWGVAVQRDQFIWARLAEVSAICNLPSAIGDLPGELLAALPDEFTIEVCPAAEAWWREAATRLNRGKLLTLDYGLSAEACFAPQRATGTLRAYHRHRLSGDVLARPGEQDLTAHVNFTAIQQAGEAVGLKTESSLTQAQFLTAIGQQAWKKENGFGDWTPERTRQFQTLTHPQHFGRAFRVLVQSRGDCNS